MTSSSKVVKANRQHLARQRISVEIPMFETPVEVEPEMQTAVTEMVERAKRESRAILEEAEAQADKLKKDARDQGYEKGLDEGRAQGKQEVQALWNDLRQAIQEPVALVSQTHEYLSRLNDEATLAMAAALSMAVFTRLKLERVDVMAAYIEELAATVHKEDVEVFLDPTWAPRLKALEEALGEAVSSLTVAVDESLATGVMRAVGPGPEGALGGPLVSLKAIIREVLG